MVTLRVNGTKKGIATVELEKCAGTTEVRGKSTEVTVALGVGAEVRWV